MNLFNFSKKNKDNTSNEVVKTEELVAMGGTTEFDEEALSSELMVSLEGKEEVVTEVQNDVIEEVKDEFKVEVEDDVVEESVTEEIDNEYDTIIKEKVKVLFDYGVKVKYQISTVVNSVPETIFYADFFDKNRAKFVNIYKSLDKNDLKNCIIFNLEELISKRKDELRKSEKIIEIEEIDTEKILKEKE